LIAPCEQRSRGRFVVLNHITPSTLQESRMGFFGKSASTVRSLSKDIARDRANHVELTARLEKYRAIYGEREKAARAAILANESESVITAAESERDEAKRRIGSFEAALSELGEKIAEEVKQHDDLVSAEIAERIAIDREKKLADYRQRFEALLSAARDLLPVAEDVGETTLPAREIADVVRGLLLREFPVALERAEAEVQCYIRALRSGAIRPTPPTKAAVPASMQEKPAIPTRRIYSLTQLEWPSEDGSRIARGAHEYIDLPLAFADFAVSRSRAIEMNDPKRQMYVKQFGQGHITYPPLGHPANAQLDDPALGAPVPVFGADIHAQNAGMKDSRGATFNPVA
jgi:hypothetical protein